MCHKMLLSLSFISFCLALSAPGYGLDVEQVSQYVRKGNAEVRAAEKEHDAAASGVDSALSQYYPTIELKNRVTRMDDKIAIDLAPLSFAPEVAPGRRMNLNFDPPPITVQEKEFRNSTLVLTQPIYVGGKIAAGVEVARASKEEARFQSQREYQKQLALAYERYFQVKLASEVTVILQRMSEQLARLHKMAEVLVSSGSAPKLSVMKIEVSQAELQSRLQEARNQENLARLALRSVLSADENEVTVLDSPLKRLSLTLNEEELKKKALERRDEWGVLSAKQKKIDAAVMAQTGSMKPKLYAFGKYEMFPEDQTMLEPRWAVGIGLDITLTSPLTSLPERTRLRALREQVDIVRERAREDVLLEVEKYFSEAKTLEASLRHLDGAISMAEETLRLATVRYRSGDGSEMEVLDATSQLEKLQITRLTQIAAFNSSLIQLCRASGDVAEYVAIYKQSK